MIVRTQTLREPYVHIYSGDDALDTEYQQLNEAGEVVDTFVGLFLRAVETSDLGLLPIRSGQTPARWTLRHLSSDEAAWLVGRQKVDGDGFLQVCRHAVALAVTGVEGARGTDGKPIKIERRPDADRRGFICVVPEQMETIFGYYNRDLVEELGGRVFSTLRPPKG